MMANLMSKQNPSLGGRLWGVFKGEKVGFRPAMEVVAESNPKSPFYLTITRGPEIEPSDYQGSRHRTWRKSVDLWEGLARGVSNYQNSNAKVERMLNDGTVLVLG